MKRYWILSTVLLALIFLPLAVQAAHGDAGFLPCNPLKKHQCTLSDLLQLVINFYNYLLGFAGFVLLAIIIFGGIRMFIYSFMEDAPGELESAKRTVTRGIFGFILVAAAYLIVSTLLTFLGVDQKYLTDPIPK